MQTNLQSEPSNRTAVSRARELFSDSRGAVMLEYTITVGAIAIAGALGLLAIGIAVVQNFQFVRSLILCAIP
jgi:hypothetical protein